MNDFGEEQTAETLFATLEKLSAIAIAVASGTVCTSKLSPEMHDRECEF